MATKGDGLQPRAFDAIRRTGLCDALRATHLLLDTLDVSADMTQRCLQLASSNIPEMRADGPYTFSPRARLHVHLTAPLGITVYCPICGHRHDTILDRVAMGRFAKRVTHHVGACTPGVTTLAVQYEVLECGDRMFVSVLPPETTCRE